MTNLENRKIDRGRLIVGAILIALGLFLLGPVFGIQWGHYLWPFFIIVPGVLLCFFALTVKGRAGEALMIPGSIVTMLGALLFYQNITGHWASWAYAWTLIAPTSFGLGFIVYGSLKGQAHTVRTGVTIALIGGILFVIGAIFFELILNISGFGHNAIVWSLLLIGLGLFLLVHAYLRRRRSA